MEIIIIKFLYECSPVYGRLIIEIKCYWGSNNWDGDTAGLMFVLWN